MLNKIINHKYFWKVIIAIIIVVALTLYFNKKSKEEQFDLLMKAVNNDKSATGTAADLKISDAFNPRYWTQVKGAKVITSAATKDMINFIWDAKSPSFKNPTRDDEAGVVAKLKSLGYKTQVSYLADQFYKAKNRDLYSYLESFMNNTIGKNYMEDVNSVVNNLK